MKELGLRLGHILGHGRRSARGRRISGIDGETGSC